MDAQVAIVGGGLVGLTLAIALARQEIPVAVIDRSPPEQELSPQFDGRASAISWASHNLMRHIGVWDFIKQAEPILHIHVTDGDSSAVVHYDAAKMTGRPFGYIMENRILRHALHLCARQLPALQWLAPREVESAECGESSARVLLKDGTEISAPLLVSAEGRQSSLREQFGIHHRAISYGQTAIVCTIKHERPHHGVAQERFLPVGPFAVLPMTDNRSCLVWTEKNDAAPAYLAMPEAEFMEHIRVRLGDHLGNFTLSGPRFSYPLKLNLSRDYVRRRFALTGDSAHGIHPIAGQGVNLGFRDVAVLAQLIGEAARLGLDIGSESLLAHYQRWRRFDSVSMTAVTDGLNRLFSTDFLPVKLARRAGMRVVNRLAPLKSFLARDAMGLTGDLPELLKDAA
jgi:2-octaprenyl-6-methoxyphenol hydroxylase